MYRIDDLRKRLGIILRSTMEEDELKVWGEVMNELADYQDEKLSELRASLSPKTASSQEQDISEITTGLLRINNEDEANFVSDSDSNSRCMSTDSSNELAYDVGGDGWHIIGCGYLDCEYEEIDKYCGYNREYIGSNPDGSEFRFVLVRSNAILASERKVYDIAAEYKINKPLIYAPMFRRLVYIKTKSAIPNKLGIKIDLQKNGLDVLKLGWRSIWNIKEYDYANSIKKGDRYLIKSEPGVYAFPNTDERFNNTVSDVHYNLELREVSFKYSGKEQERRTSFHLFRIDEQAFERQLPGDIIKYGKFGSFSGAEHILSQGDIRDAVSFFSEVTLKEIELSFSPGFRLCRYEEDYDYPTPDLLQINKPELWLTFERDNKPFLFDRIAYVVHCLTRKYPEFCWKGGYRE